MANQTIPTLPPQLTATGTEQVWVAWNGSDYRMNTAQIAALGIVGYTAGNTLPNAANDAAAAALGVAVGSLYRNGSVLMVRVA